MVHVKDKLKKTNNIVRISFNAAFYAERARVSMNRCHFHKALKYFHIAIEKDAQNPHNYLNLAGLLAELGKFEESNEVLEMLIYDIAPDQYNCLYYIANNFLYMENFELAERYLLQYLENDPDGEYGVDAHELLDMVAKELGLNRISSSFLLKQEEAKFLLESGEYKKARELLEEIFEEEQQVSDGSLRLVHSKDDPVLECVLKQMCEYSKGQRKEARKLWHQFMTNQSKRVIIRKKETWAAAVEYVISIKYGIANSKSSVAKKYKVSTTSLSRNVERIQRFIATQGGP